MQSSHRTATAMANAISSLLLASSALAAVAACAMLANAFMTSGAPPRKFLSSAVSSFVISGQSFIALSMMMRLTQPRPHGLGDRRRRRRGSAYDLDQGMVTPAAIGEPVVL